MITQCPTLKLGILTDALTFKDQVDCLLHNCPALFFPCQMHTWVTQISFDSRVICCFCRSNNFLFFYLTLLHREKKYFFSLPATINSFTKTRMTLRQLCLNGNALRKRRGRSSARNGSAERWKKEPSLSPSFSHSERENLSFAFYPPLGVRKPKGISWAESVCVQVKCKR